VTEPKPTKLYVVTDDEGEVAYVEATTIIEAIKIWQAQQYEDDPVQHDEDDDPQSASLVHPLPVLRKG